MKQTLTQSLTQKLQQRLSPQQIRFVRLLEMSEPEVEEEVRRELDDNPALATASDDAALVPVAPDELPSYRYHIKNTSPDDPVAEPVAVADEPTLSEWLLEQLSESGVDEADMPLYAYIVGNIDGNGYFTRLPGQMVDDLAINAGVDITLDQLTEMVGRVRSLEPAGIGAYDLRDCLSLQLQRKEPSEARDTALEITGHYFDIFSTRRLDKLQALMKVSQEQLHEAVDLIRTLNPKPGGGVGESDADARTRHIIPDFELEAEPSGRLRLTLPNSVPDLVIEESFREDGTPEGSMSPSAREAQAFISRKRDEAQSFIDLLRLRRETLFRVGEAIVSIQHEFFADGDETRLRPMRLKDINALTGLDLSVISRATAGKYISTPVGLYPLKYFFNEGTPVGSDGDDGTQASAHEVLAALRRLINEENPAKPLSDDALRELMGQQGYEMARRTVSKYRERLGIPAARLRKKV